MGNMLHLGFYSVKSIYIYIYMYILVFEQFYLLVRPVSNFTLFYVLIT